MRNTSGSIPGDLKSTVFLKKKSLDLSNPAWLADLTFLQYGLEGCSVYLALHTYICKQTLSLMTLNWSRLRSNVTVTSVMCFESPL